ncbi:nicotinamide phosphoribosyltransferase-like [Anabas testudineus]|uniref:nicotinamide phosphoribosyltransferase-like n=1 Tax=Anabas testudineus TaxID=64144 RepID=UPI000E464220|nr:nicotinamide phosphoribosyltransferase-like [Anabas testudineus]
MDVYKQPVTDPSKGSKKGQLSLRRNSNGYLETIEGGAGKPEEDLLVTVFENGSLVKDYSLEEIRKNARLRDKDLNPTLHNHERELLHNHIINGQLSKIKIRQPNE